MSADEIPVVLEGAPTPIGTVLPKCSDTTATGNWYCVQHNEHFQHNMAMYSHTSTGRHSIAWNCHAHGPEVP